MLAESFFLGYTVFYARYIGKELFFMGCSHNCDSCSSHCGGEKSLKVAANPAASVKKVIGVVSGKGGVGKSLLTSMMAVCWMPTSPVRLSPRPSAYTVSSRAAKKVFFRHAAKAVYR